ncbi:hypothetical protein PoB_006223600 [Plakobranchus ocellatus]|uniref:Uncharacterized protein n=1 Tax=Plakobranchus ocellatus TaxID=259542 RepID=A0AAV4CVL0_9GAST|nr:hypothetical protein PoB_006223600 [Plakobranchus ocellatus]
MSKSLGSIDLGVKKCTDQATHPGALLFLSLGHDVEVVGTNDIKFLAIRDCNVEHMQSLVIPVILFSLETNPTDCRSLVPDLQSISYEYLVL